MTINKIDLADRYAAAKDALDAAEKLVRGLRREILATGEETLIGQFANVTVSLSERKTLDQNAIKAILSDEQIADCTKVALVETLRIKPVVPTMLKTA